jgi:hypothetical protein
VWWEFFDTVTAVSMVSHHQVLTVQQWEHSVRVDGHQDGAHARINLILTAVVVASK